MPIPAYAYIQLGERDELLAIRQKIADTAEDASVTFQEPENYHITLAYSADMADEDFVGTYVEPFEPLRVRVSGVSLFNNPEERALVLVVDHSPDLDAIQAEVYNRMAQTGADMSRYSEPQAWQPHITIGYLADGADMPQITFEPFALGADVIRYARDDYRVVEEIMANSPEQPNPTTALKALDDAGRVGGYLVVWGSSAQKDLQGEYFTPDTELGLDWYDRRPMLYHHAMDGTLKAETIGVIDTLRPDDTGVWAEAQLDLRKRYVETVRKLIDKGVLGWSSGSLPHLVLKAGDGQIKRWPIVEGSATPAPAEPRQTDIRAVKSAYKELGLRACNAPVARLAAASLISTRLCLAAS